MSAHILSILDPLTVSNFKPSMVGAIRQNLFYKMELFLPKSNQLSYPLIVTFHYLELLAFGLTDLELIKLSYLS